MSDAETLVYTGLGFMCGCLGIAVVWLCRTRASAIAEVAGDWRATVENLREAYTNQRETIENLQDIIELKETELRRHGADPLKPWARMKPTSELEWKRGVLVKKTTEEEAP